MSDNHVEDVTQLLSPANRLILSWVSLFCLAFDSPGHSIQNVLDLMVEGWDVLLTNNPANELLHKQKNELDEFSIKVRNYDKDADRARTTVVYTNKHHDARLEVQNGRDMDRIRKALPVLIPHSFLKRPGMEMQTPPHNRPYECVSRNEYREAYGTPYRYSLSYSDVAWLITAIDAAREEKGWPVLLPVGYRLYKPFGLEWDGEYSLPPDTPVRARKFAVDSRKYQYVSREKFAKVYGILGRVESDDDGGLWHRHVCEFFDHFGSIFQCLRTANDSIFMIAESTFKCELDGQMAAVMEDQNLPNQIQAFIKTLSCHSPIIACTVRGWIKEQMGGWVEEYRKNALASTISLPWLLFRKVYSCLSDEGDGERMAGRGPTQTESSAIPNGEGVTTGDSVDADLLSSPIEDYWSYPMNMMQAADRLGWTVQKLRRYLSNRKELRIGSGQTFQFDTRHSALKPLKDYKPEKMKRKHNQ